MFNVAIVEDSRKEAEQLLGALRRYECESGETVSAQLFENGGTFLPRIGEAEFDVIFLDIELGNMNGMDVADEIRKADENVPIIFVTNVARYAVQGYRVGALDYFLKPVSYYALKMRMEYIRSRKIRRTPTITIAMPGLKKNMPISKIYYVETLGHALTWHTEDGNFSVTRGDSLKTIESRLTEQGFRRCSSCYLVNLRWCTAIKGDTVLCGKDGCNALKMSRSLKREFLAALSQTVVG